MTRRDFVVQAFRAALAVLQTAESEDLVARVPNLAEPVGLVGTRLFELTLSPEVVRHRELGRALVVAMVVVRPHSRHRGLKGWVTN